MLKGAVISWDMERIIHCRYAPDIIQHIRRKGIDIKTEMVSHIRATDNRPVRVGKYSINPDYVKKAKLAVSEG